MTKFTLGKLILIAISTCIHTTAFAVISSPISGQVGGPGSFESIITEPPDIINVPLPERPINPSVRMLGAMASRRSVTDPMHSGEIRSFLYSQAGLRRNIR